MTAKLSALKGLNRETISKPVNPAIVHMTILARLYAKTHILKIMAIPQSKLSTQLSLYLKASILLSFAAVWLIFVFVGVMLVFPKNSFYIFEFVDLLS